MASRFNPTSTLSLSLCSALLVAACGGGGSDTTDTLSNESAAGYAANASVVGTDATSALDATLLTTTGLVSASATAQSAVTGRELALATSTGALSCAGGGTATLSITGASVPAELNGQLDAGEVYAATFTDCAGSAGAAVLNGALTMTVNSTTANGATVTFASAAPTPLQVTLPRGNVTFVGSVTIDRSVTTNGANSTVSTHVTSASLAVTTNFNNRTGQFTLSSVDLTRQANFVSGVLTSATYSGSHALSAVLPNLSYNYTVATQGGTSFGPNGLPTQGGWVITLPRRSITITVAAGTVTIAIDEGKDGSVDRTITLPVAQLGSDAG